MPLPSKRMTKNQDRTLRYRPGDQIIDDEESDESGEESSEDDKQHTAIERSRIPEPAPDITSFPSHQKLSIQSAAKTKDKTEEDLEGFVTASESSSEPGDSDQNGGSEEDSEEESSEEEDSSEEEAKPRLLAPKFIPRAQRNKLQTSQVIKDEDEVAAELERRREEKANELLQAQIERDQVARAAGKKAWDDDDDVLGDDIDDTDGLDPEAEHAAWKLRELKRIHRDREELVRREKELEEISRRRNLTAEEREAEDQELLEQQKAEQDGRGQMSYMQKYYHKGAFFQGDEQDDEVKAALTRDLAGARFVDEMNKDTLPEYMRIRDMSKLGRKGRSKYKDLKSEDTGRWGSFHDSQRKDGELDDRFQPEFDGGRHITGANAAPVGSRRRRDSDQDDERRDSDKRPRRV